MTPRWRETGEGWKGKGDRSLASCARMTNGPNHRFTVIGTIKPAADRQSNEVPWCLEECNSRCFSRNQIISNLTKFI